MESKIISLFSLTTLASVGIALTLALIPSLPKHNILDLTSSSSEPVSSGTCPITTARVSLKSPSKGKPHLKGLNVQRADSRLAKPGFGRGFKLPPKTLKVQFTASRAHVVPGGFLGEVAPQRVVR